MKEASKRGGEGTRFALERLKDPAVVAVLLILAFGVYSVFYSSSITGKAIARPDGECSVTGAGTSGVMVLGSAGNFQIAERVLKPNTCATSIQRPASSLKQFLLLGQSCQTAPDNIITLTLESGATQRLESGCADGQLNKIAHSAKLIKHVCAGNDVQVNIINCNCNGNDCANLASCDSDAVCHALPDGTARSCVDKNNGLGLRCYVTSPGSLCAPNFADECGPGLDCVGGQCVAPGIPAAEPAGDAGANADADAGANADADANAPAGGDQPPADECQADADCGGRAAGRKCAARAAGEPKRCLKFVNVACVEDSECLENAVCVEQVAGQGEKCFGTDGFFCGGANDICAPGFSCQNNVCAREAQRDFSADVAFPDRNQVDPNFQAGGGLADAGGFGGAGAGGFDVGAGANQPIHPTLVASGAVGFTPFTFPTIPAITDSASEKVRQELVQLPFSAGYGDLGFCRDYFKLSRKDANFCQFERGPGDFKTVGRYFVAKLPFVVSSVQSIAVDVKKLANSGAGAVGYHLFYSSSALFDNKDAWTWATYCILNQSETATCTKNFATPLSVAHVMVARANWGANSPTPYVTDIRVTQATP